MADIPASSLAAGIEAVYGVYAKRGWNKPAPWWAEEVPAAVLEAAVPLLAEAPEPVTEYAHMMSGGGYHVWNTEPYIEEIYPLAQRIEDGQRSGGKVYRRRVIVVEDWAEVALVTPAREEKP